jgi:hypothetical protein
MLRPGIPRLVFSPQSLFWVSSSVLVTDFCKNKKVLVGHWWLTPIILATWKAEMEGSRFKTSWDK